MIFAEHASLEEKLRILSDAAKYDVACTSSGVSRKGKDGQREHQCGGNLSQLLSGWEMHFFVEDFIYQ